MSRTDRQRRRPGRTVAVAVAVAISAAAGTAGAQTDYPVPGATQQAADLISNFEQFRADPYNDAARNGNCTIGYGTLLHRGPCTAADTAAYPNGITQQQAQQLLQNDANTAANTIDENVHVPLTQQQRDALTSFVYNVGSGAFEHSTLLRDINAGNSQAAADQLLRWVNQNGHFVRGLQNRRNAERCYFLQGATQCQGQLRDARGATPASRAAVTRIAATAARAAGRPRLTVVTRPARAGRRLKFKGSGWAGGRVTIYAFVPGISPYRGLTAHARADRHGRFHAGFRVPARVIDTFRWKLLATQSRGRHRSASVRVKIRAG
jgi:GH24 family phage-related lysozyme (muramidase)